MAGARGERRVVMLGSEGRVWTNVAPSTDKRWDGWSVLGESALRA
jgi:hypothetical protein